MKAIGGYFELELSHHGFPNDDAVLVNSGRNALEYILRGIGEIETLYLPYYTCDVVLEPITKICIPYKWYHVDEAMEVAEMPTLGDKEYILINNYFGIKDTYVKRICEELADHVIVDNSQALFTPQYADAPTFWSPRKFVGIPDGGMALPKYDNVTIEGKDVSYDRCSHLLKRWDLGSEAGYADFRDNAHKLVGEDIKQMSALTQALLGSIDWTSVKERRRDNYSVLRDALEPLNLMSTPAVSEIECPMVYPLMVSDTTLRNRLITEKVFVAKYWPNVADYCPTEAIDAKLADLVLPLPIDQRYDSEDMQRIIQVIREKK